MFGSGQHGLSRGVAARESSFSYLTILGIAICQNIGIFRARSPGVMIVLSSLDEQYIYSQGVCTVYISLAARRV
jgi:hypothetical protein